MSKYIYALITVITITIILSFKTRNELSVDGIWSIVEVQTVKPDGTFTSAYPKESVAIFTKNYYSFCWTGHTSPVHQWKIPDSVSLERLNQTIVNSGTYVIKDSILTTKALFALNPMFVNGIARFKCSFNKDTLVLTGLGVFSPDNIPNPLYANGLHIVNKLVKIK
jgi:hypothetical protein